MLIVDESLGWRGGGVLSVIFAFITCFESLDFFGESLGFVRLMRS